MVWGCRANVNKSVSIFSTLMTNPLKHITEAEYEISVLNKTHEQTHEQKKRNIADEANQP